VPRAVDPRERRATIAAAVTTVLEQGGVEAVTMRNVAAELGSTTGLLTHWVANRAELIRLALAATADNQTERALATLARRPDDMAGALEQFLPLDDSRLAEMKVWLGFWALAISDPSLQAEQRDRYRGFRRRFAAHLRTLGLSAGDAGTAADHVMTSVDGIAVAAVFDPQHWTPSRQRRHLRHVVQLSVPNG